MDGDLYKTLEQEAFVIRSCLATGLTELRNACLLYTSDAADE